MIYSKEDFFDALVPDGFKGKEVTLEETYNAPDEHDAEQKFLNAADILLTPARWIHAGGGAEFILSGKEKGANQLQHNSYLRINIPGPGPSNGDGFDWVQVSLLIDQRRNIEGFRGVGVLLNACSDPETKSKDPAHFFAEGATSTLIVFIEADKVSAQYFGRNEEPNIHTDSVVTNIRNSIVSVSALLGLSEIQWSSLLKGFLQLKK